MAPTKRTKTTKRLSLSIGVWNVNGLVSKDFDKLNDVLFLNCIKNLDIVGLVETHTTSSFISPLDDYKILEQIIEQSASLVVLVSISGNHSQMVLNPSQ